LKPPMPKVMIAGLKGSGVTTQINMICDLFKLESCELHTAYLAKLEEQKKLRQRSRKLNQGFVPRPEDAPEDEEWVNEDVMNDPWEQEEREAHEKEMMKAVLEANKGLVIDGNWANTIPEDAVSAPLMDLLLDARRMPEMLIILRCKEETTFARCRDDEVTKKKHDDILDRIKKEVADECTKARAEKEKELTDERAT
jgi:adenylate/nucleoside-diphosphate kinase